MNEIRTNEFDYSELDVGTADFLKEKELNMRNIVNDASEKLGKELYEAQQELSKHGYGCFEEWYSALGFKKTSVYEYINRFLFVRNLNNQNQIETFQELSPSLQSEMSKKSAIPEVNQAVFDGDIKTHKEYKEMERKLKEAEEAKAQAERQIEALKKSEQAAIERMEELEERKPEVIKEEVVKEIVPDHVKKRIKELEAKAGELEKYRSEINDYQKKKAEIENELAELNARAREIEKSNNALAMQAKLVNAISLPVSHLEKKKAEIEQELKRNDVTKLTDHAKNTLQLKADFLMEMAVKINNFLKEESDYVEVIDVE